MSVQSLRVVATLAATLFCLWAPALARTATYEEPRSMDEASRIALSRRGDNAGYLVELDRTLALVFDQPFGQIGGADSIAVFTLAPRVGDARAVVRFGVWNSGSPIVLRSRNVNAGGSVSFNNLFQIGCSLFGGCDFVSVTTDRARRGADGVVVDYVDVNGEVTEVAAPAPEPSQWTLMILAFAGVAWRLKAARKGFGTWDLGLGSYSRSLNGKA